MSLKPQLFVQGIKPPGNGLVSVANNEIGLNKTNNIIKKNGKSFDDIFSIALDAGAEDVEESGEEVAVYTQTSDLAKVRDSLSAQGLEVTEAKFTLKPMTKITIEDREKYDKVVDFLSSLEQLDDVQEVYSNLQIL